VRHGFKAQAERLSAKAREALGLPLTAPLDPWAYALHLGVLVLEFGEMELSSQCRRRLLQLVRDDDSRGGRDGDHHQSQSRACANAAR
jgi:hypothetical protein